jgi:hypothetical protein
MDRGEISDTGLTPVIEMTSADSGDAGARRKYPPKQPNSAIAPHQDRWAGLVGVAFRGLVDDEPAGARF